MTNINKDGRRVGILRGVELETHDKKLRSLISEAENTGMPRMCKPDVPDKPHGPIVDGLEYVKFTGDDESAVELARFLRSHGYTMEGGAL